jgi:uncharacterized protein YktA (UPF0223 family)
MNSLSNAVCTKHLLNNNNYRVWLQEMELLLGIHEVDDYVYSEKLPTIKKANQVKTTDTKLVYLPYPHDNDKVYDSSVTKDDIKHDKLAKYLINNSISDEIKVRLDFRKLSAYQVWKALEKSNKRSDEERISELKKELGAKRYNRNDDISLYISELNNIYSELESLGENYSDEKKFNQLYLSLPYDIIIESHIIAYGTTWKEATEHLIKVIPHLKYLKELKNKQKQTSLNLSTEATPKSKSKRRRKGVRCGHCRKFGHTKKDCWGLKRNKSKNQDSKKKTVGQANYIQVSDDSEPGYEDAFREDYNDKVESSCAVTSVEDPRC